MGRPTRLDRRAFIARELVWASRVLASTGLVEAFGHVSARVPGTEIVLLTPRIAPGAVSVGTLVEMDLSTGRVQGGRLPLEWPVHASVYRADGGVGAICRIHGPAASVLSVIGVPVRPLHYLGTILGGPAAVYPGGGLVTTPRLGQQVARALRGGTAVLLRGNGQVVVGRTLREACVRAIYLEEAARVQLAAMLVGRPRFYSSREVRAYAQVWEDEVNLDRAWAYYVRRARLWPRWNIN
ncbi:MAG: class II aldolase/adducin family protein [Armatimonadota bacterium]|nr:class II aldolase/adducin family protein [Armatimonadota bacterium]MDR7448423.1 class II aldolase/adducin family protein [Armatimonadota bacterium]MDR7480346.1 class II aldolase/adducin family protein [Armatimonadota bacterium]MDR7488307.1 class II aldolase/adducin family protein [Armatimonadota bacterium]MDR7491347.1 class II aldolase/adducin family protein [Armatimonadota bacterium]